MPLSDHEQRILEEIERQFYEQDPKSARELAGQTLEAQLIRNFRRGLTLFVGGFVILGFFFLRPAPVVGVVAFLLMLAGATLAYQNVRKAGFNRATVLPGPGQVSRFLGSFEQRLRNIRRPKDS